jgi:hypothetical protein
MITINDLKALGKEFNLGNVYLSDSLAEDFYNALALDGVRAGQLDYALDYWSKKFGYLHAAFLFDNEEKTLFKFNPSDSGILTSMIRSELLRLNPRCKATHSL